MSTIGYYICVPFAWLVRLFYNLTGSYGVALILFTLVIKLIMLPFQMKSKKSMMRMSRVSGQMQDIQKRYANNQVKLQEEMQKIYEEEGVNPMSGCLWGFLPLPILMALYSIIRQPITHFMMLSKDVLQSVVQTVADAGVDLTNIVMMDKATGAPALKDGLYQMASYGQINLVKTVQELGLPTPEGWFNVNYKFIGMDLAETPWTLVKNFTFTWAVIGVILIPILAGLSQFVLSKITMNSQPQANAGGNSMKSMMYMMPLMYLFFCFTVPCAFSLYYVISNVIMTVQTQVMRKIYDPEKVKEEVMAEIAAHRKEQKRGVKSTTLKVKDEKTGEIVEKNVSASEMNKRRLEYARQLDEEKYKDERTVPLSELENKKED